MTYPVREVPRGPVVGWVDSLRKRQWFGTCIDCGGQVVGASTRPEAARLVVMHVRRKHWSAVR